MSFVASFPAGLRIAVAISATALTLAPAFASHRHHVARAYASAHRAYVQKHAYAPYAYARAYPRAAYPYPYWGGWQAAVIARATAEQQNAPGVTNELAPDNLATATGGPVGGVPGFSAD